MGEQLLWAVKNGESDVVKKIIVSELFAVNIVQCVFLTVTTCCVVSRLSWPLFFPAQTDSKVDVNAELMNGRMAIHYAADYGHDDVISVLIQLKADVNVSELLTAHNHTFYSCLSTALFALCLMYITRIGNSLTISIQRICSAFETTDSSPQEGYDNYSSAGFLP